MYSREKVLENIEKYNRVNAKKLRVYSVEEARFYADHFEKLTIRDPKKDKPIGFSRTLTEDEIDYISNERMMCSIDFIYELERYEFVEDVISAELTLMKLNKAQQVALFIIADLERRGVPIRMLFLKARQLGVSTLFSKIIKHRMNFVKSTKGVIASGDEDKTRTLVEKMIEKPQAMMPWWLVRPDVEFLHSGDDFMIIPSADSLLKVQHGRQETGIARGDTVNTWHFTELLEWLDPESLIEASFNKAVHESARTFGVEETTASARGAWLHEYWEQTSKDYPAGRSSTFPVFLPYFIGDDIYPPPGYFPIVAGWKPTELTLAHAESCKEFVRSSKVLSDVLGSNWEMPLRQMWWYENEYEKASKDPQKFATFLAECPANPRQAFQSRSKSVVSAQTIQELEGSLKKLLLPPIYVSGPDIPKLTEPPERLPIVQTIQYEHHGLARLWTLHASKKFTNVEEELDNEDKLWIWRAPERGFKYVVSVDCGHGVGEDRSAIQVIRIGDAVHPAEQVAEYCSSHASAFDIIGLVMMLLAWYSTEGVDGQIYWALAAPEDAADGATIINELRKWGWPNIYVRQSPENRNKGVNDGSLYGWHTDQSTRQTLINWFLKFVKERRIQINSPWLLDEIRTFVMIRKKSLTSSTVTIKIQHDRSAHDDLIFGLAIGIVCGHQIDIFEDVANSSWGKVAEMFKKQLQLPNHSIRSYKLPAADLEVPAMVLTRKYVEREF